MNDDRQEYQEWCEANPFASSLARLIAQANIQSRRLKKDRDAEGDWPFEESWYRRFSPVPIWEDEPPANVVSPPGRAS